MRQIADYQAKLLNIETKNHVENVSDMSVFIARKFSFTDKELYLLKIMAKFHDIGKTIIPIHILERNGPLTDEELLLVRKHPEEGLRIMRNFGFLDEETKVIIQHHEKPNGKGYPKGLKGDEIDFAASIVSVVDVMDALLSDRAYKTRWSPEKVKDFFIDNDEYFHQEVVDMVLINFRQLLGLRKF